MAIFLSPVVFLASGQCEMKNTGLRYFAYYSTTVAAWFSGGVGAAIGALNKVPTGDEAGTPEFLQALVNPVQDNTWWCIPLVAGITAVCVLMLKLMGKPWVWDLIHDQINQFRDDVFREHIGEHQFKHQVTLFRRYSIRNFFSFCNTYYRLRRFTLQPLLIPVARSGDMNQKTTSCFIVSSTGTRHEGVAGLIWASKTTQLISDLPHIKGAHDFQPIKEYATKAGVEEKWVKNRLRSRKMLARALWGFPIRVKGNYWGVVVLDSTKPDGIAEDNAMKEYARFGSLLTKLLERV